MGGPPQPFLDYMAHPEERRIFARIGGRLSPAVLHGVALSPRRPAKPSVLHVWDGHRALGQHRYRHIGTQARELGRQRLPDVPHRFEMRAAHILGREVAVEADPRLQQHAGEQLRFPFGRYKENPGAVIVASSAAGESWSNSSCLKLPCSGKPSLQRAAVRM